MKRLLILRHAKSSWGDVDQADHDRPLNKRGKRAAPSMGRLIANEELVPGVILSSTARRAEETALRVAEAVEFEGELRLLPELYLASAQTYMEVLADLSDDIEIAMVVGHNPGLERLVAGLSGEAGAFPTAALAVFELGIERWSAAPGLTAQTARLLNLWRPRELL